MALSIKNARAEALAAEVSSVTGETLTQAVIVALEERLERLRGSRSGPDVLARLTQISERCSSLPDLDGRPAEEILGYGPSGTFEGET